MAVIGIDIGGSGVKGAPVDTDSGTLLQARHRVPTPGVADTDALVEAVAEVVRQFDRADRIGVTFPGVIVGGSAMTAANLHPSWAGAPAELLFTEALGVPVTVVNDADAAGIAEMAFGAGRDQRGVTMMLTFGTGIGSALFVDGVLVPNTELGHVELRGTDAEKFAAERVRTAEDLDWPTWAARVEEYLRHIEALFTPDLFIIGGGVSRKAEKFLPHINLRTPVVPAGLQNNAGIIGVGLAASRRR